MTTRPAAVAPPESHNLIHPRHQRNPTTRHIIALQRSVTVVLCTLAIGNVNYAYYVVRTLLAQLVKSDNGPGGKEARTRLLRDTFHGNSAVLKHIDVLDALLEEDTEAEGATRQVRS